MHSNHTLSRRRMFALAAGVAAMPQSFAGPKKGMIVRSARPEDLEMPLSGFSDFITPVEHFFVRSHHYTPAVELKDWRLSVSGEVATALTLTMDDLKKLPRVELISVLECAGNGRGLYEPSVPGLQWDFGSVGNGRWAGVRLADVLKRAGIKTSAKEILFDGADVPVGTMPEFKRTVPLAKAMHADTILAFEMNGELLPVEHGFPLRLIVPGWAGDSWVKWITKIEVLDKEFDGFFMKTAYRHPGKNVVPGSAIDPALMSPLTSLRIKSLIASHTNGAVVAPGPVKLTGAAWGGDSPVAGVDVSVDGGRNWHAALLNGTRSPYSWRLWEYRWSPKSEAYYQVMVRARSANGELQPFVQEWNPSGYGHNVVHTVGINVSTKMLPVTMGQKPAEVALPPEYKAACMTCHANDVVEQQRLTRGQWEKEVEKMMRWGAELKPDYKNHLIDFLVNRWGPRSR